MRKWRHWVEETFLKSLNLKGTEHREGNATTGRLGQKLLREFKADGKYPVEKKRVLYSRERDGMRKT